MSKEALFYVDALGSASLNKTIAEMFGQRSSEHESPDRRCHDGVSRDLWLVTIEDVRRLITLGLSDFSIYIDEGDGDVCQIASIRTGKETHIEPTLAQHRGWVERLFLASSSRSLPPQHRDPVPVPKTRDNKAQAEQWLQKKSNRNRHTPSRRQNATQH